MSGKSNTPVLSINKAADALGKNRQYVHKLVKEGKIPAKTVAQYPGSDRTMSLVSVEDVERYFAEDRPHGAVSNRADGKFHFDIYLTREDAQDLANKGYDIWKHKTHQRPAVKILPEQ